MKKILFSLVVISLYLISCSDNRKNKEDFPVDDLIVGLVSPILLDNFKTEIHLEDFISELSLIDSITLDTALKGAFSQDKKILTITYDDNSIQKLSEMKLWSKGTPYSILLKKTRKIKHTLTFDAQGKDYKSVSLTGDMFNWNKDGFNLTQKNGIWEISMLIYPGKYQYQLILNGIWSLDPGNAEKESNGMGGYNSVLRVGTDDNTLQPNLSGVTHDENTIRIHTDKPCKNVFVFWQNFRLSNDYLGSEGNDLIIKIPLAARNLKRSYIRVFAYNEHGLSNDLYIPLNFSRVLETKDSLDRNDLEAQRIYFVLVDRFFNGNLSNDQPLTDKEVHAKANYMGGDLNGILKKITSGYFQNLGFNTLWISPIAQNPIEAYKEFPAPHRKYSGYHGYWPISSSLVDFRFGSNNEFKELVKTAHEKGLSVLLDYVANHVHEKHPVYKKHPEWATSLNLPDGRKNIRIWDECRLTTWFDTFLPTLNLENPDIVKTMTDSALFWIKEFDVDGFRHDATKHIPELFWRELMKKLKKEYMIPKGKRVYQIGETFGTRELIGSYISSGMMDAQFDFNLYFDARTVFAKDDEPFTKLKASLNETFDYYGYHHLMGNISGNHDLPRFISLASGDVRFDEDDKEAGWNREISVTDKKGYAKLKMLLAFISTIPGVPVVYYGDEIGMPGAGDPDNRRMMRFEGLSQEETAVREVTTKLFNLRKSNLALIFGDFKWIQADENTMVYCRKYFSQTVYVVFNKSKESKELSIDASVGNLKYISLMNSKFSLISGKLNMEMLPYSFDVLFSKEL